MQQALAEELKCPVCLELLDDPVLLRCPHSLCRKCMAQQTTVKPGGHRPTKFKCPLCRERTPIPNGVASVKRNLHVHNIVGQLRKHESPPTPLAEATAAVVGPRCARCEVRAAASGCQLCGVLYCEVCSAEVHTGAFARHNSVPVDAFQRAARRAKLVCEQHGEALKWFCPKCAQLVCAVCKVSCSHYFHGCQPIDDAEGLPPIEDMEEALRAMTSEMSRLKGELLKVEGEVDADEKDSILECRKVFDAFIQSIQANTTQRLALVKKQKAAIASLLQRVADMWVRVPGAKAETPEHVVLHCLVSALGKEVWQLEVTTPPLLRLKATEPDLSTFPTIGIPGAVMPRLPAPGSGRKHRCRPSVAYSALLPQFQRDPPVPGLVYSQCNRRCRRDDDGNKYLLAMAKEGFASGQQQFTVCVIQPALFIGVAIEAPSKNFTTGEPHGHGIFLCHSTGIISGQNGSSQQYTTENCFPAGCLVTMQLNFAKGTASYEVDGRDLGVVECPLPKGPLFPAVLFCEGNGEVEFAPATEKKTAKRVRFDGAQSALAAIQPIKISRLR
eukprot:EG_transcript_7668